MALVIATESAQEFGSLMLSKAPIATIAIVYIVHVITRTSVVICFYRVAHQITKAYVYLRTKTHHIMMGFMPKA